MKTRSKNGKRKQEGDLNFKAAFELGYLYRDIEAQLNTYGAANGGAISTTDAAQWVGKLILAKAGRGLLVNPEHMPEVRGAAAPGHEVGATAAAVHVRTRGRRTLSKAGRKAISDAQKARWAKTKRKKDKRAGPGSYWSKMSLEDRKIEMRRRMAMRKAA